MVPSVHVARANDSSICDTEVTVQPASFRPTGETITDRSSRAGNHNRLAGSACHEVPPSVDTSFLAVQSPAAPTRCSSDFDVADTITISCRPVSALVVVRPPSVEITSSAALAPSQRPRSARMTVPSSETDRVKESGRLKSNFSW